MSGLSVTTPPLTEALEDLLVFGLIALAGAAVLAWALRTPTRREAHERARARFAAGQGRDPDRMAIGPHRSWVQNFRLLAAGALGFLVVFLGLSLLGGSPA